MDMNPDKMKARFHELTTKVEKIRAKSDPIRARRDKVVKRHGAELAKLNKEVTDAETGLFDIEQERAMIARAVRNVGEPVS